MRRRDRIACTWHNASGVENAASMATTVSARRSTLLGSRPVALGGTGLAAVAELGRRRSHGRDTLGHLFRPPTLDWVAQVRDGLVRQRLEEAVGWRTGELQSFGPPLLMLGAFERSGRRRTREQDLTMMVTAFTTMAEVAPFDEAQSACELLHRLCADESTAWSAGDLPRARALRVHQHEELAAGAGGALDQACVAVLESTPRQPYAALAQVAQLWLDRERGGSSFSSGE